MEKKKLKLMTADPYNKAIPRKICGGDMFGDTYPTCAKYCEGRSGCEECAIQECFDRLMGYESLGISPRKIRGLKNRDTAKPPVEFEGPCGDTRLICPNCRNSVINYMARSRHPNFCMICGQRLKWVE